MKILLVHNRYGQRGGEDAVVEVEASILSERGHEVRVLTFDNKDLGGSLTKLMLSYQLIHNRSSFKRMIAELKDFKPDVAHVHNLFYVASPSILRAASKDRVPVILTLHNYRVICAGGFLLRNSVPCELCVHKRFPLEGIRYGCFQDSGIKTAGLTLATGIHKALHTWDKSVSRYIAMSEFCKNKFIHSSLGVEGRKIVVKPNSVDAAEVTPFSGREAYFLFVGRLSTEKGIGVLLKAMEQQSIRVEIIGDGPLRPEVEAAVGKNANIVYWGFRDKQFILSKLQRALALIVPSLWYEGLPVSILESFSTGTPVITSDIGNLNEIVTDRHDGLHFKTSNPDDLRRVLIQFINERENTHPLYENARNTFLTKYTHELNYKSLMEIYADAIRESQSTVIEQGAVQ